MMHLGTIGSDLSLVSNDGRGATLHVDRTAAHRLKFHTPIDLESPILGLLREVRNTSRPVRGRLRVTFRTRTGCPRPIRHRPRYGRWSRLRGRRFQQPFYDPVDFQAAGLRPRPAGSRPRRRPGADRRRAFGRRVQRHSFRRTHEPPIQLDGQHRRHRRDLAGVR
jgi:hypothetical protein